MVTEPRSPPSAVKALPMASERAVPSYWFSLNRYASAAFCAYTAAAVNDNIIVMIVFLIIVYLLNPLDVPELLLKLAEEDELLWYVETLWLRVGAGELLCEELLLYDCPLLYVFDELLEVDLLPVVDLLSVAVLLAAGLR